MIIITFQDNGQDFLEWHVDPKTGRIKESIPFQADIWGKYTVTNIDTLAVGGYVEIANKDGEPTTIKYPIEELIVE